MGGGGGGGLMVPRGGMGGTSSFYPGGGIPSVHSTGRQASSRSETGIAIFPGILGGSKHPKVRNIDINELYMTMNLEYFDQSMYALMVFILIIAI